MEARISASSAAGPAPWSVSFSGTGSTSRNPGPLTYRWDFGDGSTSDQPIVTHIFQNPGYYLVKLTVTDSLGERDTEALDVRAAGKGASASITTDVTTGLTPLTVQFDGTGSGAPDDTIRDYYWDFGDGTGSRESKPHHTFYVADTYTVTLVVETGGGVQASTSTTITAGKANASLAFSGSSFATLPLDGQQSLTAWTFEVWVKAGPEGGTVLSLGDGLATLDVRPAANSIDFQVNNVSGNAAAAGLTAAWRHLALTYDAGAAAACVLYLDGVAIGSAAAGAPMAVSQMTVGMGLRGNVAEVRFWSTARSGAVILSSKGRRLTGQETGLLGYWPCDEGQGQLLQDHGPKHRHGSLGTSVFIEPDVDPTWSSDGPPLP